MHPMADSYHLTESLIPDETEESFLLELWNQEYPAKLCHKDIEDFRKYLHDSCYLS